MHECVHCRLWRFDDPQPGLSPGRHCSLLEKAGDDLTGGTAGLNEPSVVVVKDQAAGLLNPACVCVCVCACVCVRACVRVCVR